MNDAARNSWSVAQAKARLSEVIDKAMRFGPQLVTRHGRPTVVLVSVEDWRAAGNATPSDDAPQRPVDALMTWFNDDSLRGEAFIPERRPGEADTRNPFDE